MLNIADINMLEACGTTDNSYQALMFVGPCIILITEE